MANSILAAILSFLIPGLGQFYCGNLIKGLLMFILYIILLIIVSILFKDGIYYTINLIYCIYAAYNAYNMAKTE